MVPALRLAMIIIGIARFSYGNSLMKSIMYLIYLLIQFLYVCFVKVYESENSENDISSNC